jgi:hypothetical protein
MVAHSLARRSAGLASTVIPVVSGVALLCVYQWSVTNTSEADREIRRFAAAALVICCALAIALITSITLGRLVVGVAQSPLSPALAGSLTTTAAAAAATLLIAMAISPATDPGEFGRPLFRVAYFSSLVIAIAVGASIALALSWGSGLRARCLAMTVAAAIMALSLAALAQPSADVNYCVVDDEFPLRADFICSGH